MLYATPKHHSKSLIFKSFHRLKIHSHSLKSPILIYNALQYSQPKFPRTPPVIHPTFPHRPILQPHFSLPSLITSSSLNDLLATLPLNCGTISRPEVSAPPTISPLSAHPPSSASSSSIYHPSVSPLQIKISPLLPPSLPGL